MPPDDPQDRTSIEPTAGDSGILTVWVPNEAKVTINGMLTKSTGSKRHFVSSACAPATPTSTRSRRKSFAKARSSRKSRRFR